MTNSFYLKIHQCDLDICPISGLKEDWIFPSETWVFCFWVILKNPSLISSHGCFSEAAVLPAILLKVLSNFLFIVFGQTKCSVTKSTMKHWILMTDTNQAIHVVANSEFLSVAIEKYQFSYLSDHIWVKLYSWKLYFGYLVQSFYAVLSNTVGAEPEGSTLLRPNLALDMIWS